MSISSASSQGNIQMVSFGPCSVALKYGGHPPDRLKRYFFTQIHYPGQLGESDFTDVSKLGVTIGCQTFNHLIYHFVLTYSNWEARTICFFENFESLSEGLQNALWELLRGS